MAALSAGWRQDSLITMYVPKPFAVEDEAEIGALLGRVPFGCLVTNGADGLFASHLPFVHRPEDRSLAGHLARANPHRQTAVNGEALVIFQGPNAYISPSWYPAIGG